MLGTMRSSTTFGRGGPLYGIASDVGLSFWGLLRTWFNDEDALLEEQPMVENLWKVCDCRIANVFG